MIVREVWAAQVRGDGGRFERAALEVDEEGRFRLSTRSVAAGSDDVAVLDRDDVVRLFEVLDDELGPNNA